MLGDSVSVSHKTIALVGAPNSGKTTLYNWLTNSHFKTVNYPGATVEYSIGAVASQWNFQSTVVDTPGVYSLQPKSLDESIASMKEDTKSGREIERTANQSLSAVFVKLENGSFPSRVRHCLF